MDNQDFNLLIDEETAEKFAQILSDESLMHAGYTSHQANSDKITPEEK